MLPKEPNLARRPPLIISENPVEIENRRLSLLASIRQLTAKPAGFDRGATAESYRSVRQLASRALFKPPTQDEFLLFEQELAKLTRPAIDHWTTAQRNLIRLKRPAPRFGTQLLNRLARQEAPRPVDAEAAQPSS